MGTNKRQFAPTADTSALDEAEVDLCFDPQTSGGLLAAVDAAKADDILGALHDRDIAAVIVGSVTARAGSFVTVRR
jgi:selenide,water dikinase